jgi:hypothetical protein
VAPEAAACPACGLAAGRFEAFERDPIASPPEVTSAWLACGAAWQDDAAHERFRAAVAAAGAFAFAAGAYRQAARERPGDERAADGLLRVQRMAEAALLTRPVSVEVARAAGPGGRGPFRGPALVLVVLLLVAVVGVIAAFMIQARRGEAPEPPRKGASRGSW